mgnify:CR=1 FL=1
MWCKTLAYMRLAVAYAAHWDFDWLVGLNEDQYVVELELTRSLRRLDPREPIAVAHLGCGQLWRFKRESQNGTLPRPRGAAPENTHQRAVTSVREHGGFCGGTGSAWSRAALELLFAKEPDTSYLAPGTQDAA